MKLLNEYRNQTKLGYLLMQVAKNTIIEDLVISYNVNLISTGFKF